MLDLDSGFVTDEKEVWGEIKEDLSLAPEMKEKIDVMGDKNVKTIFATDLENLIEKRELVSQFENFGKKQFEVANSKNSLLNIRLKDLEKDKDSREIVDGLARLKETMQGLDPKGINSQRVVSYQNS